MNTFQIICIGIVWWALVVPWPQEKNPGVPVNTPQAEITASPSIHAGPPYEPTPDQAKDLKIAQLEAEVAQGELNAAQRAFQNRLAILAAEAEKVKAANHWPDDVTFSSQTLKFSAPAPKPEAPKK